MFCNCNLYRVYTLKFHRLSLHPTCIVFSIAFFSAFFKRGSFHSSTFRRGVVDLDQASSKWIFSAHFRGHVDRWFIVDSCGFFLVDPFIKTRILHGLKSPRFEKSNWSNWFSFFGGFSISFAWGINFQTKKQTNNSPLLGHKSTKHTKILQVSPSFVGSLTSYLHNLRRFLSPLGVSALRLQHPGVS